MELEKFVGSLEDDRELTCAELEYAQYLISLLYGQGTNLRTARSTGELEKVFVEENDYGEDSSDSEGDGAAGHNQGGVSSSIKLCRSTSASDDDDDEESEDEINFVNGPLTRECTINPSHIKKIDDL